MKTVFIAGATGYLGRYLCADFQSRGWYVTALVRDAARAADLAADVLIEGEATRPDTLHGIMDNINVVVSALGITRQTDGLGYWDVDFQANLNLLNEAERAGVERFGYIHVLNADLMRDVPLVAAKSAFVEALRDSPVASTVIAPSGYFSDMGDFLSMARSGRVWIFGDGETKIAPIHGADLATVTVDAIRDQTDWIDAGGPTAFSMNDLANLAFQSVGTPPRIIRLPDMMRKVALLILPWIAPRRIAGPAQFFLTAMAHDMCGTLHGHRELKDHFAKITGSDAHASLPETTPTGKANQMTLRSSGGYAALLCAATYLFGFALLLTLLAPLGFGSNDIDPRNVVAYIETRSGILILWNTVIYVVNALALVVLVLALHAGLVRHSPVWADVSRALGLIWATLVLGAGMIANVAVERAAHIALTDPERAAVLWEVLHSVELGFGGGNEIAGGAWLLCISFAAWKSGFLGKITNGLGLASGIGGLATIVPFLGEPAGVVFGLGAIAWFIAVGIGLISQRSPTA